MTTPVKGNTMTSVQPSGESTSTQRGVARSKGVLYGSIVGSDRVPPPPPLVDQAYEWIEVDEIDVASYTSQAAHDLEAAHLWPSSWQMACRLEHIPDVGDHLVYEICDQSIIVVRVSAEVVKAFHNSCLHRGTTLVEGSGNAALFRCPFHGWAWNLDGTFRGMSAGWDFPHVDGPDFCLPEASVALWGGFVMVNPDCEARPFEHYAAPLTDHFAPYPLDDRYLARHASQIIGANWKAVQEAFLEAYHVTATHPHTVRFANDQDCVYDVFGPNMSRIIQPIALPADHLVGRTSETELADIIQRMLPKKHRREVPGDVDARGWLAERFRDSLGERMQHDFSEVSDAGMLDTIQYFLFPNFFPFAGYAIPIVFRFRPWDNDPNKSLMEAMLLHPIPADGNYETAELHQLEPGESWTKAPGFEMFGIILDQDMANLPRIQRGLQAASHNTITLSDYQEIRLRHFRQRLDEVITERADQRNTPP